MNKNINIIFFHGKPASGKDTQANLLIDLLPSCHIVSGVYRSAFTQKGKYAKYHKTVKPCIQPFGKGIDIPGETVAQLLRNIVVDELKTGSETLIVCGLPRTIDHLAAIDAMIKRESETIITDHHFCFDCSNETSLKRAAIRRNLQSQSNSDRPDDVRRLMKKRLDRYSTRTKNMLEVLKKEERLHIIESNCDSLVIHQKIINILNQTGYRINVPN